MTKSKVGDLAGLGATIAKVLSGSYVGAAIGLVKNRKIIISLLASFFIFAIIICALLVSIPTIMMQSLLPQDKSEQVKSMADYAQEQITQTEKEKESFLQNLMDSLKGESQDGKEIVTSIKGDINYQDVLIIYALKNSEFWEAKEHDSNSIREIANTFVEVNGFDVTIKPFEEVVKTVGLNTTQQAIAMNMYAYNLNKDIDLTNETGSIYEGKIRNLQSEGDYAGGHLILPTPGYTRVSSGFGYRIHPILHVKKLHTGIDIPVPSGTEIVSANAGTVIMAGFNDSYGNVVVVDHGGGIATLYAHNSKLLVRNGQEVKQGETISYSGSTGRSTGPHLHFEVRVDGKYIDPMNWL